MATVVMPLVFAARCTSGIPESGHGCAQRHTTRSRRPPSGTALNKAQPALAPSTGVRSIGQLPSQQGQIAAQADPPQHGQKTAAHGGQHTTDRAALMWPTRHATPTRDADTRAVCSGALDTSPRPHAPCKWGLTGMRRRRPSHAASDFGRAAARVDPRLRRRIHLRRAARPALSRATTSMRSVS